ncbi:Zinc/iron permease [Dothidotthia symphoricarpi CBS 119687]|uniref:Zinc/iron permease n=1 Tax=Dothidotthia symphoricarpi CBS 119687 TaxID=1392245 RepID=A0A6A6APB7_9PLEO|nr:Zinc/iron permease [Dothidotthia symphoricarpi CBS 119687]KAF2132784.1 Zinc/iron permease [Dothidotthia symphoricarpi CBS 119687]
MTDGDGLLAGLSSHLLRAELLRRQENDRPVCGTKGGKGSYNTPLHVFALVLILSLSTAACSFPIVVRRFPSIHVPHQFLFISRHFGTGVLIATAFVHLLPTAFESLTDPCLPHFWNTGYPAMPGFIAMTSVFVVVGIEMFFASKGAGHSHSTDYESLGREDHQAHTHPGHKRRNSYGRYSSGSRRIPSIVLHDVEASENLIAGRSPSFSLASPMTPDTPNNHAARDSLDDGDDSDLDISREELGPRGFDDSEDGARLLSQPNGRKEAHAARDDTLETSEKTEAQNKKQLLQCLLLEAGILFHSVFIGMALSVATGTSFIVLLVAISFHQTFEGFALGSRISAIRFPEGSPKPWFMALAYGTTTPIGQAIGLAIHTLYDPASETGLLTVGFMNAISSGLLLFAGLVELLAEDFLSDESYVTLQGKRRLQACASVVGGALLMALVGAWA